MAIWYPAGEVVVMEAVVVDLGPFVSYLRTDVVVVDVVLMAARVDLLDVDIVVFVVVVMLVLLLVVVDVEAP